MMFEVEGTRWAEHRSERPSRGTGDRTILPMTLPSPSDQDEGRLVISYYPPRSGDEIERLRVARVLTDLAPYQAAGWDGEDAAAIAPETLQSVRDLLTDLAAWGLTMPDTAPAVDGSACMEWRFTRDHHEIVIFIDIGPSQKVMSYTRGLGPEPEERHFDTYNGAAKRHMLAIFDQVTRKTFG